MPVVPISHIPEVLGSDLEKRVELATDLHMSYIRMRELPLLGSSIERWIFSQGFPWVMVTSGNAAMLNRAMGVTIFLWILGVAALAWTPALVIDHYLGTGIVRATGLFAIATAGVALGARSARMAFAKRYRAKWGTHRIGWRTWTALTAGAVAALSVGVQSIVGLLREVP